MYDACMRMNVAAAAHLTYPLTVSYIHEVGKGATKMYASTYIHTYYGSWVCTRIGLPESVLKLISGGATSTC
jgi:hypothetical protein